MREIRIFIPDTEEFDKQEQQALYTSFKTICDNLGVDGVLCTTRYVDEKSPVNLDEVKNE